jgi:hypothetical protein
MGLKGETEDHRAKRLQQMYQRDCEALRLVAVDERGALGRYYLRPESGFPTWAEVVVLRGGSLLVHGDVDTTVFSSFHKPTTPRDVLHWIGRKDTDYGYLTEKASIGGSIARCFDEEVALAGVVRLRREKYLDADQARELCEMLRNNDCSQQEFSMRMYELTDDPEISANGTVTHPRVFMAWAVVTRLLELLPEWDRQQALAIVAASAV